MICPNENIEMHQVKIESHYGLPVILEQCKRCGGIWFDKLELFMAKQGQAEKIELLDSEILSTPSTIEKSKLICPRDQAELVRFTDRDFPKSIIVERCPVCDGFWLNRGEFTKYQKARQELQRPKEHSAEDKKFKEDIQRILAEHRSGSSADVLGNLGRFLSTPIDTATLRPLESDERPPEEGRKLDFILNILTLILRAFIFR